VPKGSWKPATTWSNFSASMVDMAKSITKKQSSKVTVSL
jgi:hypothetical protein